MREETTYLSENGTTQIHAYTWKPEGAVRAAVQIIHGMQEFVDRYADFAQYLNVHGILVCGNDHLGHGASIESVDDFGFFGENGNAYVLSDIRTLHQKTKEAYPNVPYFLLGHSMGSFLARQYITMYGEELAGAIISGTGSQPPMKLAFGKRVCKSNAAKHGWRYRSEKITQMAVGSYNKIFEPARTPVDWLTKEDAVIDKYMSDQRCTFLFTVNGYYEMFKSIGECQSKENMARIPKDLPLFFVSGAQDPVGDCGRGVQKAYESYLKIGMTDVSCRIYPDDRHEILNETDKDVVYADLLAWISEKIK